jgi:N-acetylneuraminic acid mutarotase
LDGVTGEQHRGKVRKLMNRLVTRLLLKGVARLGVASVLLSSGFALAAIELPLTTTNLPDLPTARDGAAAVFVDDALFVVGGATADGFSSRVDRYDVRTGAWKTVANLEVPRRHVAAVAVREKIFVFGGKGPRGPVAEVEVVDVRTGKVTQAASMPTPRYFASAALYRGRVFVAGGTMGWGRSAVVEVYDPGRDAWFVAPSLGKARDTQLVVSGRHLFALGGYTGEKSQPVATMVERLDRDGWSKVSDMPMPTSSYTAVAAGAAIYTFGDHRDPGRVMRFDPMTGHWKQLEVGFFPRRHAAATSDGHSIWVVGGSQRGSASKLGVLERLETPASL